MQNILMSKYEFGCMLRIRALEQGRYLEEETESSENNSEVVARIRKNSATSTTAFKG